MKMNKDKILKLCDEIENTLSDAWNSNEIEYELAGRIVSFAKKIAAEITAPPKSNADRIRQMTDEELVREFSESICNIVENCEKDISCYDCKMQWLKQEVREDAGDEEAIMKRTKAIKKELTGGADNDSE